MSLLSYDVRRNAVYFALHPSFSRSSQMLRRSNSTHLSAAQLELLIKQPIRSWARMGPNRLPLAQYDFDYKSYSRGNSGCCASQVKPMCA